MLQQYTVYFVPVIIGIIFGEILFQNNRHMILKWRNDVQGWLTCIEHSAMYSIWVFISLFLFSNIIDGLYNYRLFFALLVSHFVIETLTVHVHWMKFIKQENSPLIRYYLKKLAEKYPHQVNDAMMVSYIKDNPILQVDEELINNNSFYITEMYSVSLAIHTITTFSVVVVLSYYGWI